MKKRQKHNQILPIFDPSIIATIKAWLYIFGLVIPNSYRPFSHPYHKTNPHNHHNNNINVPPWTEIAQRCNSNPLHHNCHTASQHYTRHKLSVTSQPRHILHTIRLPIPTQMCHLGALSFIHHHFLLALTHVSPSSINFQMTITAPFISSSSCIHNSQLKPHTPQYHHIILTYNISKAPPLCSHPNLPLHALIFNLRVSAMLLCPHHISDGNPTHPRPASGNFCNCQPPSLDLHSHHFYPAAASATTSSGPSKSPRYKPSTGSTTR